MKLTEEQFKLIVRCACHGELPDFGPHDSVYSSLMRMGFCDLCSLTDAGWRVLEQYRVHKLLILAAGMGARLNPITSKMPKPLVKVNGISMIETILNAAIKSGIDDITIVRGYLGDQLNALKQNYPMIKFIENPIYNQSNNISSALYAKELFAGSYVCDGDLIIKNPALFQKYQYCSNYMGIPVKQTEDWCLTTQGNYIDKMVLGGTNCHIAVGFSYWTPEDGARLAQQFPLVFQLPEGKSTYWEQTPMEYFRSDYQIQVRECSNQDVIEIDTYEDLCRLDPSYRL